MSTLFVVGDSKGEDTKADLSTNEEIPQSYSPPPSNELFHRFTLYLFLFAFLSDWEV